MKKRRLQLVAIILVAMFVCTGCGTPMYDLTEDERDLIVHYSAYVLGKYNINQTDGLNSTVYDESLDDEASTEDEATDSEATDDTTPRTTFGEALGYGPMLQVTYKDMKISDTYKEGSYYLMTADKGYTYAVMNFTMRNGTADPIQVDAFTNAPKFSADFGGTGLVESESTFLTYSLTTYQGTLKSGQTVDLVLIFMIPDSYAKSAVAPKTVTTEYGDTTYLIEL